MILDTSAFIQGFDPQKSVFFTVPKVRDEVKGTYASIRLENAFETGKLHIVQPEHRFIMQIEEKSVNMGEASSLSRTDKELLALAIQVKAENQEPVIVSDDYSIQNMAETLGIKYLGLATPGIKKRLTWSIYCPGCKRIYSKPQKDGVCPICGTELRRKPKRQTMKKGSKNL